MNLVKLLSPDFALGKALVATRSVLEISIMLAARPSSESVHLAKLILQVKPVHTMVRNLSLVTLYRMVRYVNHISLPGTIVECGVWKGGSSAMMASDSVQFTKHPGHRIVPFSPPTALTRGVETLIVLCLLLSGIRLISGIEAVIDLGLFDETGYLYAGTHLLSSGLMPPAWSPLYGVWYFGLSLFQPDPVALYYLNYRILSIITPLLIYLLLRVYQLPRIMALLAAWFFLISAANLPIWPKPGSLALCLIMLLLIAFRDLRTPTRSVLLLSVGLLICSYVRPEYLLAAGLLFVLYLALLWRHRRQLRLRVELIQLALALVVVFGLIEVFSLVPLDRNNNRSFEAFAQHYAINWADWNQSEIDPWTEFAVAIERSFGPVTSLSEAIRANPVAVARHLMSNALHYPGAMSQLFLCHFNPLLPAEAAWAALAGAWLLGAGLVTGLGWGLLQQFNQLPQRLKAQRLRLIIFVLLAAPALSSAIIIYPHSHYLLLHGVLLTLVAGLLLVGSVREGRGAIIGSVVLAGLLLVLTPPLTATWLALPPKPYPTPNRSTIEAIRALQITQPVTMLEADGASTSTSAISFDALALSRRLPACWHLWMRKPLI